MLTTVRPRIQALTGAVLLLVAVLVVVLIYKTFRGDFGDNVQVTATVLQAGDSLDTGDIVTYRDVIIGEVTSFDATSDGGARVSLRIKGEHAADVPGTVTALAVPASLFGRTKIILVPPANTGGDGLRDGGQIAADASPSAAGLQTALSDLYTLLSAVKPSELNGALTALAQALDGRGDDIGRLIDQAAEFLDTVAPAIPDLKRTIRSFATVTEQLARTSPALLGSLSNALTPAAAIVRQQGAIRELLAVAPPAADRARGLLEDIDDDLVTVVTNARPVLQAFADNADGVGATVVGFRNVGQALNSVFRNGRVSTHVITTGVNFANLVPVLLGQQTNVVDALADPPSYTSADCPRYPGAVGPNCASSASTNSARAAVITIGGRHGGRVSGSSGEVRALRTMVGAMSGVPSSQVSPAVDLVLGPLLRSGVSR